MKRKPTMAFSEIPEGEFASQWKKRALPTKMESLRIDGRPLRDPTLTRALPRKPHFPN